jgi:two-component system, cell cycle response regulator
MARKYRSGIEQSGYTILVVDDDENLRESTRSLLEAQGHRVLTAEDGACALAVLATESVDVMLLDFFMPGMTGDHIVRLVRETNELVRIILVTGYAGEKPAREMMRQLDIQGYHEKSEGAERLLLWIDAALNTYRHVRAVERYSTRLQKVIDCAPTLYQIQSLDMLLSRLVEQTEALLEADSSFLATLPRERISATTRELFDPVEVFVALDGPEFRDVPLEVRYGTGRFEEGTALDNLPEPERSMVWSALRNGEVQADESRSIIPLRLGDRTIGVIFIGRGMEDRRDRTVLEIFTNQAAAAMHNTVLFEGATVDSLTGAFRRGFALQRLGQMLKDAHRRGEPVSVLMVDLDHFKQLNDRHGHYVGDRALAGIAHLMQSGVRETDLVGRMGGDEFMVVLPGTPAEGAMVVAERMAARAAEMRLHAEGAAVGVRLSMGIACIEAADIGIRRLNGPDFRRGIEMVMRHADAAMYAAKHSGRAGIAGRLTWADVVDSMDATHEIAGIAVPA